MKDDARNVVESYFAAWTANDIDTAYSLLASDLKFTGPTASYESAEAFRPALVSFASMIKQAALWTSS
jgi:ketosteroid isomerase-like protein